MIDALGGVVVFVNNAGVNRRSPVLEENLSDWERVLTTDLTGPFLCAQVMALELAPYGITVNAIAPGETATPMNGVAEEVDAGQIGRPAIPVGRPGRAV